VTCVARALVKAGHDTLIKLIGDNISRLDHHTDREVQLIDPRLKHLQGIAVPDDDEFIVHRTQDIHPEFPRPEEVTSHSRQGSGGRDWICQIHQQQRLVLTVAALNQLAAHVIQQTTLHPKVLIGVDLALHEASHLPAQYRRFLDTGHLFNIEDIVYPAKLFYLLTQLPLLVFQTDDVRLRLLQLGMQQVILVFEILDIRLQLTGAQQGSRQQQQDIG